VPQEPLDLMSTRSSPGFLANEQISVLHGYMKINTVAN
jgi:hypothetical protein